MQNIFQKGASPLTTIIIILILIIAGVIILNPGSGSDQEATVSSALGKSAITLGRPAWPGATVKSEVAAQILEKMGYETTVTPTDPGIMYTSLADKQIDLTVAAWLPTTHAQYWSEKGEDLEIAGVNVTTTWLGLGVPSYTDESIQSIEDLAGADSFRESVESKITGIDPGAGIMINTEKALSAYGLADWELQSSSASAMLTALQDAVANEEPVIATVWEPHSAFKIADLRKLEDPKGIYNSPASTTAFLRKNAPEFADAEVQSDVLASVVYKGFEADAPAAYEFLRNFRVPTETQSGWIFEFNVNEREPEEIAEEFIRENAELVRSWVPEEHREAFESAESATSTESGANNDASGTTSEDGTQN